MSNDIYNVTETRIDPDIECNIQMLMLPMRDGRSGRHFAFFERRGAEDVKRRIASVVKHCFAM